MIKTGFSYLVCFLLGWMIYHHAGTALVCAVSQQNYEWLPLLLLCSSLDDIARVILVLTFSPMIC